MPGIKNARKQREMHQKCTTFQTEYQVFFRIRLDPTMSKSGTVIKDQFQLQIQFFCLSHVSVTHLSKHYRGQR